MLFDLSLRHHRPIIANNPHKIKPLALKTARDRRVSNLRSKPHPGAAAAMIDTHEDLLP